MVVNAVRSVLLNELAVLLERLAVYNCSIVICGDFNIHDDQSDGRPLRCAITTAAAVVRSCTARE